MIIYIYLKYSKYATNNFKSQKYDVHLKMEFI